LDDESRDNRAMNWQKILAPILGVVLLGAAWRAYSWAGIALVATGLVMWALLHFNRLTSVLKKAADRPKGYVGSAVMLNAKLKPKVNLLHVIAMTESLGERLSDENAQPEIYRWTDGTQSHVTCEFDNGKLAKWTLYRPPAPDEASPPPAA
jgi:hypothetical protein